MDETTLARLIDECREEQESMQVQSDDRSVSELSDMQLQRVDRTERNIREASKIFSDIQLKLNS